MPVAKFIKREVEKNALDKSKMEQQLVKLTEAVGDTKIKFEDGIPTKNTNATRSPSPPLDLSDGKATHLKAYSTAMSSD